MKSYKISLDSQCICPYPTSPTNFGPEYAFSKIAIFGPVGGDFPVRAERVNDNNIQSDLVYPVLFYPDPSPSGRKLLITDFSAYMYVMHTYSMYMVV